MWQRVSLAVLLGLWGAGACASHTAATVRPPVVDGAAGMDVPPFDAAGTDAPPFDAAGFDASAPTGPAAPCGNGQIDPGELCDGASLNNATCSSLGFSGGTLSCSFSCQLDASGCTGGRLTPAVTASRTACAAPCAVSFNATATTGLGGNDYVAANWNWDFGDPTSTHKGGVGFVTAHVFDHPGSYQVSTRVRDNAGAAGWGTTNIKVIPMTGTTYYVATSGSDSNSGTSMSSPLKTISTAFTKGGATNNSILLRRGDTFAMDSISENTKVWATKGPFLFGSYSDPVRPSAVAPILTDGGNPSFGVSFNLNGSDIRLQDIHYQSTAGIFTGFYITGANVLLERVEGQGVGSTSTSGAMMVHVEGGSGGLRDTLADCNFHDFRAYGLYANVTDNLSIIGTSITKFSGDGAGSLHGIRIDGTSGTGGAIHGNHFVSENAVQAGTGAVFTAAEIHGNTANVVIAYNTADRPIAATPVNAQTEEQIGNVLFEGNFVQDPTVTSLINITANHVVARDNVLVNPNIAITVVGASLEPASWVDQVLLQNNTAFFCPPNATSYAYPGYFAQHASTTGSLTLQNNLYYVCANNPGSAMLLGAGTGKETIDHNLLHSSVATPSSPGTGTAGVTGDPAFATLPPDSQTTLISPTVFALRPGSAAIGAGTPTTAYQDLQGVPRPQSGWDIGAFQSVPGVSPAAAARAPATHTEGRLGALRELGRRAVRRLFPHSFAGND